MRQFPAIIAAFVITGLIGFAMFAIGGNALLNKHSVPTLNSPAGQTSTSANGSQAANQTQVQQMQNLINQYQQREKQYQSQLNQVEQQLNQANTQVQQYQSLLQALQNRGVIFIEPDGRILIPQR